MKHDFDSYLPTFKSQIRKRVNQYDYDRYSNLIIKYMDQELSRGDEFRFQFHLPDNEKELFAGVLFAHTLLTQILHFYKNKFLYIPEFIKSDERKLLYPEIIGGLLSIYDKHICPTIVPLGVLYVDELTDDKIPFGDHLSRYHARLTWCKKRKLFQESIDWLKLNLTHKVLQLTGATISSQDKTTLLDLIDVEMQRFDREFDYTKTWWIQHSLSITWKYIKKVYAFSWRSLLIYLLYKFLITSGQFGKLASLFDIRTEGYDIYQQLEPYQVHAVSLIHLILRLEDVIALLLISLIPRCIVTDKLFRVDKVLTDKEWRVGFRVLALVVLWMAFNGNARF